MSREFDVRPNKTSGSLFAATLVLSIGAFGIASVVATSGGDPLISLAVFPLVAGAVLLLALLLRGMPTSRLASSFSWMKSRDARPANEYAPRAIRSRHRYGTNHPPTVEELRELKDGLNNWVPSNVPAGRRSPPDRLSH